MFTSVCDRQNASNNINRVDFGHKYQYGRPISVTIVANYVEFGMKTLVKFI